jgi:DNA-binding Xre family transcriptional regulator
MYPKTKLSDVKVPIKAVVKQLQEPRELLAAVVHNLWTNWMEHLLSEGTQQAGGGVYLPSWHVRRWRQQMETAYKDLRPDEQASDQEQADEILTTLVRWIEKRKHGQGQRSTYPGVVYVASTEGLARMLVTVRKDRDWTQSELAERAGLSRNEVSRLERGCAPQAKLETLEKIAAALDSQLLVTFTPEEQGEA